MDTTTPRRPAVEQAVELTPHAVYTGRLEANRAEVRQGEHRGELLANGRLLTGIAGLVVAVLAFAAGAVSAWWLAAPVVLFAVLVEWDTRIARTTRRAASAIAFYERGLARLEDRWAGRGEPGTRFLDPEHPFAGDLDLFGTGSLFERICTARTRAGEEALAGWLRSPAALDEIRARQEAVEELRSRLDLREDLARLGSGLRDGLDTEVLTAWGREPARLPAGLVRPLLAVLGLLGVAALLAWGFTDLGPLPFVGVVTVEIVVAYGLAARVRPVLAAVESKARDLRALSVLLERIEGEPFGSPRLLRIRAALDGGCMPPSRRIAQLARIVDRLELRQNQFFAPLAAILLWATQHAMAVEAWRRRSGSLIADWLAAVGEFEALASLAAYAFENPEDPFPELLDDASPVYDATGLAHPLLPRACRVANDIRLDRDRALLVVSGSNMSGKSTMLRTVGINAVLAQIGAPVRAERLALSPLIPGGTIRIQDSLQAGRSRFYAEILRLRLLVDLAERQPPLLFLIDEILNGTNSHDRRQGSAAIVRGLLDRGAIGLITTHDLSLAEIADNLAPRAENVHFEDQFQDGQLAFDYRMRPGVVRKSNALELMRAVGLDV